MMRTTNRHPKRLKLTNYRTVEMSTYLNRPQLAARAECCDQTLCKLVRAGAVTPDALDARGRWLFSENRVAEVRSKIRRRAAVVL